MRGFDNALRPRQRTTHAGLPQAGELPFPKRAGATVPGAFLHAGDPGVPGRSTATAGKRASLFAAAWRRLERRAGKQLHPGRKDKLTRGLRPLGYHPPLSGFSRRPLLLGGEATERALCGLLGLHHGGGGRAPGSPLAMRKRPMYLPGRPCLLPGMTPAGREEAEAPTSAEAGDGEAATSPAPAPPGEGARPKRKSPAIIRLPAEERAAVYAQAAPGGGQHDVQKQPNGEWQCTICKRPGFRNPKALRATTCLGPGLSATEVQSRLKKEAARARHLQEAEAARRHNAAVAAGGPGVRKHVLVPQGDTHRCEECGLELPTMLRARNLGRECPGQAPEGEADSSENEFPPEQRHKLRQIPGSVWQCEVYRRKEGRKRLKASRCWGPGAKTKS